MYKSRYGDNLNSVNALSYTGLYVLIDAIARAGCSSPIAIREALENTDIPGDRLILPWNGIRFNETDQNILADSMVVQVLNQTNKKVWPKELAETNVVLPYPCA
jgi:branched-chain amino acid transport system substrate-binding protein